MSETNRQGIFAAGHWVVDQVKRIDHWPEPATLARIADQQIANGGFAFNLLCDLAALDPACPLFAGGAIGDDSNGKFVRERCGKLGIDTSMLRTIRDAPTSFTDVMTEAASGRRTFFYCAGANDLLEEKHLKPVESPARYFCLGYLGCMAGLDAIGGDGLNGSAMLLRDASAAGLITAADLVSAPNPRLREQVLPSLPFLDVLFLNEWEAGQLLGREVSDAPSSAEAIDVVRQVRGLGLRGTAVLHFPRGAVAALAEGEIVVQGSVRIPSGEIKGTVGAGDALAAGVLLGRYRQMDWAESLKLGVCAAAACLMEPAASDGLRGWKGCLELGEGWGFGELKG